MPAGNGNPLDVRPTPDPTVLTTEALARGLSAERDYTDAKMEVIFQRFEGMDLANQVLNETVTRTPTEIQKQITHLRELMDEKFASVGTQFKERDTRSERESRDNKVAVDAAFAAQKEAAAKQDEANQKAIDKSEKATNETISKNAESAQAANKSLADKIDDGKSRQAALELALNGTIQNASGGQTAKAAIYGLIGLFCTLTFLGLAIAGFAFAR